MAADELVPVSPDEAAQLPGGGNICGRGHALLQGDGVQLAGMGQLYHRPAAGHIHFPALFCQSLQIGKMEVSNMRKRGCHKENAAHG